MTSISPPPQVSVGTEYITANNNAQPYKPITRSWKSDFKVDCSYMRTTSGILKVSQQISIIVAAISTYWAYITTVVNFALNIPSEEHYDVPDSNLPSMKIVLIIHTFLLLIWLPVVHSLMWYYILHRVEKFPKYPWYGIEYTICGVGAMLCLIATPIFRAFVELTEELCIVTVLTLLTASLFIYNIVLVRNNQMKNLPLQS